MDNNIKYPKVLIIYNTCINKEDQHGVSLRSWFADWPCENLAQIYSGGEVGAERFCGSNFKIGKSDRNFGNFFFKLKNSSIGQISYPISPDEDFKQIDKISLWSLFKTKISNFLINTGLWELIFKPKLSKKMIKFVEDFDPQIIYCQGYSLTFTWLPIMIHQKFNIPICFQTGDDWPSYLYSDSLFSFALKKVVTKSVKSLLSKSKVRFANSKLMASDYYARYNIFFETLMMCDNQLRFRDAIPIRVVDDKTISIVYSGNLGQGRWVSIVDLCKSAKLVHNKNGQKIIISAFASAIPPEAINELRKIENLQILPSPSHEDLPSFLKGADILFLPETFDPPKVNEIRLSISTKAHLYMMSEKPILVYAHPATGIVNYAKEEGWACIVQEQNSNKLAQALCDLVTNDEYCMNLVSIGHKVASINHDARKVREIFLYKLNECKMIN